MEKKKLFISLGIIILIIAVGVIGGIYISNKQYNNEETNEYESYQKISLDKKESTNKLIDNIIYEDDNFKTITNFDDFNVLSERWSYDGNAVKYVDSNTNSNVEINNIVKIKYAENSCSGNKDLFLINNEGKVYYTEVEPVANQSISFNNTNKAYNDIYLLELYNDESCSRKVIYLLKDSEDNYYNLTDESKFNNDTYYTDINENNKQFFTILTTGKISELENVTFKKGIYLQYENNMNYFISSDNYLYKLENFEINKVSDNKIKNIYYNDNNVIIEYEDNTDINIENVYFKD
jgi:hypothetical protein